MNSVVSGREYAVSMLGHTESPDFSGPQCGTVVGLDIEHHRGFRVTAQTVRQMTHTDQRQRPPKTSPCAVGSIPTT